MSLIYPISPLSLMSLMPLISLTPALSFFAPTCSPLTPASGLCLNRYHLICCSFSLLFYESSPLHIPRLSLSVSHLLLASLTLSALSRVISLPSFLFLLSVSCQPCTRRLLSSQNRAIYQAGGLATFTACTKLPCHPSAHSPPPLHLHTVPHLHPPIHPPIDQPLT